MDDMSEWDRAREFAKKEQDVVNFQYSLTVGKNIEQEAANKLEQLGFIVEDISNKISPDGNWSPFDLRAAKHDTTYIIDVKRRSHYGLSYWFSRKQLASWKSYITPHTKLVLFVVKGESYRYITIDQLERVAFRKRGPLTLHVEIKYTKPLGLLD